MRTWYRFLVPVAALAALLAFTACDDDDADPVDPTPDCVTDDDCDDGYECVGGECVAEPEVCDPPCDPDLCEVCVDGDCVSECVGDEVCVDGECVEPAVDCDPPCDPDLCEVCVDGDCVSECVGDEVCVDGECVVPPAECDPPCDADECFECVLVEGEPECVYLCDTDNCYACDGAGNCEYFCEEGEICDGAGDCVAAPECADPNEAGFCDASIVSSLAIAGDDCCCDFTGDGMADNAIAGLLAQLGPMLDMDISEVNLMIGEMLESGDFAVMFEYIGLADGGADTALFMMNFFLGGAADPDGDILAGDAEVLVDPMSLDDDGLPLITFETASVEGGLLTAGPGRFVIPIDIEDPPLSLELTVDGVQIEADLVVGDHGYEMHDGTLCGYILGEEIFKALNDFVATSCDCLNLGDDLIVGYDTPAPSCTPPQDPTCDPDDDMEEICSMISQYCSVAVGIIPMFLDIDLDGDPNTGQAISLGALFSATSAEIIGVMAE